MKIEYTDLEFTPDAAAIAELTTPGGLVGEAADRLGERMADRIRGFIESYGLIDTGEMIGDVTYQIVEANADGVTVSAGTPNVEYTLYQREPFLLEALAETQPSDLDQ